MQLQIRSVHLGLVAALSVAACSSSPTSPSPAQSSVLTPVGGTGPTGGSRATTSAPVATAPTSQGTAGVAPSAGTTTSSPSICAGDCAGVGGAGTVAGGRGGGGIGAGATAGAAADASVPNAPSSNPAQSDAGVAIDAAAGAGGSPATGGEFTLHMTDFPMSAGRLTFPASALPPMNKSPGFSWSGVPDGTQSVVLVFRDIGISAIKWMLWDVPPSLGMVPSGLGSVPQPPEVPGSSQLGSLMNVGYAGPVRTGQQYDFTLYALRVAKLPGTEGKTTAQIFQDVLPMQTIAKTPPVVVILQ